MSFSKFSIFRVDVPLLNLEFHLAIFRKLRGRRISKFRFRVSFWRSKTWSHNFSGIRSFRFFLGIKSEINQWSLVTLRILKLRFYKNSHFCNFRLCSQGWPQESFEYVLKVNAIISKMIRKVLKMTKITTTDFSTDRLEPFINRHNQS